MKKAIATAPGKKTIHRKLTVKELADREAEETVNAEKKIKYEREEKYKDDRVGEYPAIGDQLDAIWKELNYRRLNGDNLVQDADDMLGQILAVKSKYAKP